MTSYSVWLAVQEFDGFALAAAAALGPVQFNEARGGVPYEVADQRQQHVSRTTVFCAHQLPNSQSF